MMLWHKHKMKYTVKNLGRGAGPFGGNYDYLIYEGARIVAEYRHDFRNDECAIRIEGDWVACGRILAGGGPQPLMINAEGEKMIDQILLENRQ